LKKYRVKVNDKLFEVEVEEISSTTSVEKPEKKVEKEVQPEVKTKPVPKNVEGEKVTAPLPGTISIEVNEGAQVNKGDVIFILEAMKMENEITAPTTGTVKAIYVAEGASVDTGELLAVIE
jgi:biotin carboxyl carrier protein